MKPGGASRAPGYDTGGRAGAYPLRRPGRHERARGARTTAVRH